jgi:glycosyltransferase involved in cell wall biosynthesis
VTPRVSVIVTCYDLGRYLDEAVASVLAQTFQDFEVLVVDDGSTDAATVALLADYRRPRTRVLRTPNAGLPAAKNAGIRHTSGEYLCALDADDRLEPAFLARSVAALDADPELAFASHWLRCFGDETGEWRPSRCDLPALLDVNTVNGAALVRRSAVLAVGGFDESLRDGCEDWDLWIGLLERGYRGTILPEVLYAYRRRPGSMSRAMLAGGGHPELYRRLVEKHAETFRRHLPALLRRRDADLCRLEAHLHDLELEHERWLGPELARHREHAARLREKLERPDLAARLRETEAALAAAREEVAALRRSASWRVTAPLRRAYDAWRRIRGR